MFTGIVQQMGRVESMGDHSLRLKVRGSSFSAGDSVAVDGACLTVSKFKKNGRGASLQFDTSEETLSKTTLSRLKGGDKVNIETPLQFSRGVGGHFVTGHVEGVGRLQKILQRPHSVEAWFSAPKTLFKYIAPKGSIAVDGISLTVVSVSRNSFSVSLVPFTLSRTTLGSKKPGDPVNLETDILAKYAVKKS
jgi:riboflavin synthase